ncbi:MAG: YceI family protein [Chthoniobacterales bacterium]
MKNRLFVFVSLVACARFATAETYKIDPQHSQIAFSVHQLLGTARGEFHQFSGTIVADRDHPERSSVLATIQVASIDTQIRRRDDHLLSADFFDAKRFPTIVFRSRSVTRKGESEGEIAGELTMKGVTRPLTLHVKLLTPIPEGDWPSRTRWLVTAQGIRRSDFGLMFGGAAESVSGIGQLVTPAITIEAIRGE